MKVKIVFTVISVTMVVLILLFENNVVQNNFTRDAKANETAGTEEKLHFGLGTDANIEDISTSGGESNAEGFTLFLTKEGVVYSAGDNQYGQIGCNSSYRDNIPVRVCNNSNSGFVNGNVNDPVVGIAAGGEHSLIITKSGILYTFGRNNNGQLGDGTTSTRKTPVKVSDNAGFINDGRDKVVAISAGYAHSLFVTESGKIYGFGDNGYGQLGDGSRTDRRKPVLVRNGSDFINDGKIKVISVATGRYHSLFLTENGKVYSFGYNGNFVLGDNTTTGRTSPVSVKSSADGRFINNGDGTPKNKVIDISAGWGHSLILTEEKVIYSFGWGADGRLGDGSTSDNRVPTRIPNNGGFENGKVLDITAGAYLTFVVTTDGVVYGTGYPDSNMALGINSTSTRTRMTLVKDNLSKGFENNNIRKVVSSGGYDDQSTFVIKNDNKAFAFGSGNDGQLGNGRFTTNNGLAVPVGELSTQFSLTGKAIKHDNRGNETMIYSSEVVLDTIPSNKRIEIKKDGGSYVNVTTKFQGTTNGGVNKYIIGVGTGEDIFSVKTGEAARFTIRVTQSSNSYYNTTQEIVIDKKIPEIVNLLPKDTRKQCNVVNDVNYCSENQLVKFNDFTGVNKLIITEEEITSDITSEYLSKGELGASFIDPNSGTEEYFKQYKVMDGAGNILTINLALDNSKPRTDWV